MVDRAGVVEKTNYLPENIRELHIDEFKRLYFCVDCEFYYANDSVLGAMVLANHGCFICPKCFLATDPP